MQRKLFYFLCATSLTLFGCGGGGSNVQGGLSGVVFDINGNPVRGATVYTGDKYGATTTSNSNGSYILNTVQGEQGTIHARLNANGISYVGQNTFQVFSGQQTKSVNITLVPNQNLAEVTGTVYDRSGNIIGGAQVYAIAANGYSSSTVLSDNNGNFTMPDLVPGVSYTFSASGRGYNQDTTVESLNNNENRTVNFTLNNPTDPQLQPPTNFVATAYTSPAEATRSRDQFLAMQNMKAILQAKRGGKTVTVAKNRTTPQGNLTEVDLTWTPITDPGLLGYAVYRGDGNSTPNSVVAYFNDPLSSLFADLDPSMLVGQTYTYDITALNTDYGYTGGYESVPSTTSSAIVLGDMNLQSVDTNTVTFNWSPATDAANYAVYLFDQYPYPGVNSIWNNDGTGQQVSGTSVQYGGTGSLIPGNTYYYIVIGRSADGSGVTLSPVGTFVKS